jgi:hypothetical protein
MSEETQTPAETPSTTTEATLDDVYTKYNVEESASTFGASKPEQQQQPQFQPQQNFQQPAQDRSISVPDPTLDPAGHKQWETARYQDQQTLRQALHSVAGKLNQYEQAQRKQAEEAEIGKAVEFVNSSLGDAKLDPDVVEISLGAEARRDPRFLALWENRQKNPKALQEGLKAFSNKLAKKFSMRVDPQIAENQRALKEATSTKATGTAEESLTDKLGKLHGAEFDRAMSAIRNNYQ